VRELTPEELERVERYRQEIERANANVDHFDGVAAGSICPLCQRKSPRRLAWDHDHATDKFRGYICSRCNMALGLVSDNVETLLHMIAYLTQH
jgi:Autographiviridae endonuclease VII